MIKNTPVTRQQIACCSYVDNYCKPALANRSPKDWRESDQDTLIMRWKGNFYASI